MVAIHRNRNRICGLASSLVTAIAAFLRCDYNINRLHASLHGLAPIQFATRSKQGRF